MRKKETADFIEETLIHGRSVVLIGCKGIGKWRFINDEIIGKGKLQRKKCIDASFWRSEDFFKKLEKSGKAYQNSIICIPDIFGLKDAFSIINLLFDRRILFLATSSCLVPQDDPDYSSIAGRFASLVMGSPDYRDWQEENGGSDYSSFYLSDFPGFKGDETLLEIIRHGLRHGKRIEEQSKKLLSLMKCALSSDGPISRRYLSLKLGYSVHTVDDYLRKLESFNLLHPIKRMNLSDGRTPTEKTIYYPTFSSFYQFSEEDLAKKRNITKLYLSKLVGKLLSYGHEIYSGYRYSTQKGLENRYLECGLVIKKDSSCTFMQMDLDYNENKAKNLLSIKDGNSKYFVVFSDQKLQILNNGLRLVGIDRLIKGDLGEL